MIKRTWPSAPAAERVWTLLNYKGVIKVRFPLKAACLTCAQLYAIKAVWSLEINQMIAGGSTYNKILIKKLWMLKLMGG